MHEKVLQMLGICKRAGKLVAGFDAAKAACANGSAKLVLCSTGLSERTQRGCREFSAQHGVDLITTRITLEEIQWMIGRMSGVVAITDGGLAERLRTMIGQDEEEISL